MSNNINNLRQQIIYNSGLSGKELENLKARLDGLSEKQLQEELTKSLAGCSKTSDDMGLVIERTQAEDASENDAEVTDAEEGVSETEGKEEVTETPVNQPEDPVDEAEKNRPKDDLDYQMDFDKAIQAVMSSDGQGDYDPRAISLMFTRILLGQAEDWKKVGNNRYELKNGGNTLIISGSVVISSINGSFSENEKEKIYSISAPTVGGISTLYSFNRNGVFLSKEVSSTKNPDLVEKYYADGHMTLTQYDKNNQPAVIYDKDKNGNITRTMNFEYENGKIKERTTLYTDFYPDKEWRNIMTVENDNCEVYMYEKVDKNEPIKFTKEYIIPRVQDPQPFDASNPLAGFSGIDTQPKELQYRMRNPNQAPTVNVSGDSFRLYAKRVADTVPVLNEKGEVVRNQPLTVYHLDIDKSGKAYLDHTYTTKLEDIKKDLKPGEHCDFSRMNSEIEENVYNVLLAHTNMMLELLTAWKEDKSIFDGSTWLNFVAKAVGEDVDSAIDGFKNYAKQLESMKFCSDAGFHDEFAKIYKDIIGRDFDDKEKQKWLNANTKVEVLKITKIRDMDDLGEYLDCFAKILSHSKFGFAMAGTKGNLEAFDTLGAELDIVAMIGEFKAISWGLGKIFKGAKWLYNAAKGERIVKYTATAAEYLNSERKAAQFLKTTGNVLKMSAESGLNFAGYDGLHEFGRQVYNGENISTRKIIGSSWHGFKLGFSTGILSSMTSPILMKYFKEEGELYSEISESVEKTLNSTKKQIINGEKIAESINSVSAKLSVTGKVVSFPVEVATFTIAASAIDLTDGRTIKDSIKQDKNNRLSEEQIENMSTQDLMRAVLNAHGISTVGMSGAEVFKEYASCQYKEQFLGIGHMKMTEQVIGMFLSKGHMPKAGHYGKRVKALDVIRYKDGSYRLKSDPSRVISTDDVINMTYRAMAFDNLDARMTNRFNKYKKEPMSGKEFLDIAVGADHEPCEADNLQIKTTKDKKYEITTPDGRKIVVDDIENVLEVQQDYEFEQQVVKITEEKIKDQWLNSDIHTAVPEEKVDLFNLDLNAGLKEPAPEISGEVTSLIFTGKLGEHLTARYDRMGKVFEEIAQNHSAEIEELAKQNPNNPQKVAEGIVKILSQELGMEGFEPPIERMALEGADGYADWPNGRILIDENITDPEALTSIISHEFVHMLQYRDVLAQYGEQGLCDMIANDKTLSDAQKEQIIQSALNNEYNKHLLDSYDMQKAQTGTVEDYMRRIYSDELANANGSKEQVIEGLAYNAQGKVERGINIEVDTKPQMPKVTPPTDFQMNKSLAAGSVKRLSDEELSVKENSGKITESDIGIEHNSAEVIATAENAKYPGGEPYFSAYTIEFFRNLASLDPELAYTLLSAKDAEGLPVIKPEDYNQIYFAYKDNPAIAKELVLGNRDIPNYQLRSFVYAMEENPDLIRELLNAKNSNGNYKYPVNIIDALIKDGVCSTEISKTDFDGAIKIVDNICDYLEENNINPDDVYNFTLNNENKFQLEVVEQPYKYEFNTKGEFEQKVTTERRALQIDEISDNGQVRTQGTVQDTFGLHGDIINVEREVKDENGQILYKEVYRKSNITNKYDIIRIEPDGKEYKIGFAEKTPQNEIIEERNFSIDEDTQLNSVYMNDSKGNRVVYTKVVDIKNKKVLFESSQKFKVLDENHFESTENGIKYDIQYTKDKVTVNKENGETFEISIGEDGVLDENLLPLLKQLPGPMYEAISKFGLKRLCISYTLNVNGVYQLEDNKIRIASGNVQSNNINVLLHELGHYIDMSIDAHQSKEIKDIYEEEKANFEKNATLREKAAISYYIEDSYTDGSALWETFAEVNAMKYGNKTARGYEIAEVYLHKYFPKTFAKIAKSLSMSELNENSVKMDEKLDGYTQGQKSESRVNANTNIKANMQSIPPEATTPTEVPGKTLPAGKLWGKNKPWSVDSKTKDKLKQYGMSYVLDKLGPKDKQVRVLSHSVKDFLDNSAIVKDLGAGVNPNNVSSYLNEGEVGAIGSKLYICIDGKPQEIKVSRDKFERIF